MKKNRFLVAVLVTLALGVLSMPLASCSGEVSFTTARLSEVTMAHGVDDSLRPVGPADTFAVDTPEIYLSAKFSNAPSETEIASEWIYVEGEAVGYENTLIDSVSIEVSGTDYIYFALPMPQGWPRGEYAVKLYIDGKEAETATFTIE